MSVRIGLIARMDNTGLGNQTKAFYDHMKPHKTLVVDMQDHNGNKQFPERYPDATFVRGLLNRGNIDEWLVDLDVIFVAEAPYNYYLYECARQRGIKIAVQYNYEFLDWAKYPELPLPDLLIAPSTWHYDDVQALCEARGIKHIYLHCPVDRALVPFRMIKQAKTFLHIVGRPAAHDRNGTKIAIEASKYIKSDAKILLHFQAEQGLGHQLTDSFADYEQYIAQYGNKNNLIVRQQDYPEYGDIYNDGDVMVLPRRYGGNCLPLNEAISVGMPVIMPNISPNNELLPDTWLVTGKWDGSFEPRTVIDLYATSPIMLARKIDEFYQMSASEFSRETQEANAIADDISWETLQPQYQEALEDLCNQ